jgi:hypothetical protein
MNSTNRGIGDGREIVEAGFPLDFHEPAEDESTVTHADIMNGGILKPDCVIKRGRGRPRTVTVNYYCDHIYLNVPSLDLTQSLGWRQTRLSLPTIRWPLTIISDISSGIRTVDLAE